MEALRAALHGVPPLRISPASLGSLIAFNRRRLVRGSKSHRRGARRLGTRDRRACVRRHGRRGEELGIRITSCRARLRRRQQGRPPRVFVARLALRLLRLQELSSGSAQAVAAPGRFRHVRRVAPRRIEAPAARAQHGRSPRQEAIEGWKPRTGATCSASGGCLCCRSSPRRRRTRPSFSDNHRARRLPSSSDPVGMGERTRQGALPQLLERSRE